MKLAALIVEDRSVSNLSDIIKNHMKFLPKDTQLIIYHGLENTYLKIDFPDAVFYNLEHKTDINEYNKLLTSINFWNKLIDYDRVLVFQSDSMLLKNGIEEFYEYDYIGASWTWNDLYCGNGGLSLRNPKTMLNILNVFKKEGGLNEDHWFCEKMFTNKIGKLAPINIADKFSCEAKFKIGTLGIHAINKYLTVDQCNQINNQYNLVKKMNIQEKFQEKCNHHSDINELLPYLKEYADKCEIVVELGVRTCVASYALLASNAKKVYGYDIEKQPEVNECQSIANECKKDWIFTEGDVLKLEIPECDMLFIDTFHSALQLEQELRLHANKVKKYIAFHDVVTYWDIAEQYYYKHAVANKVNGEQGLKYAIEPFLKNNPEWKEELKLEFNNGLLILKKEGVNQMPFSVKR